MTIKFPARRADGTLLLRLRFRSTEAVSRAAVERWLEEWSAANAVWEREWTGAEGAVVEAETLRWSGAYSSAPKLTDFEASSFAIELNATTRAENWKDWMARFVDALQRHFPSVAFAGADSHPRFGGT
ncbi:hypothetical protein G6O69_28500 [Pseudenhygromyxa sp. WMMC2535]|uniref:hypothetical protein n=1 Tax=Pseudenhygromyxa sp. WMMC2535 TaxID=2712867 RepID=UPI00155663C8|nr:hypothetical protein [Pseudenhygromyxa sp. WMMC2535]NVB41807.1 hypothetical protein [Pseudenhygromyxa sp. WMMC2535]